MVYNGFVFKCKYFAYDAPPDPVVGWGGGYPLAIPYPPRCLWRLDPRAFGARLGACGASTPQRFAPHALAFGCLTEAKAHPTSSFWRRHCNVIAQDTEDKYALEL